ncbi:hypothetical protein [Tenacibaculum larymnensis]|uniref:Uncharacterized protein n=1 Tax=Tenacibaculum larymnensis TaxID=2878201 RepID=A0A9X4EL74_9FLAO|nr:hypothetical protein [Tenacibaculum larymnensis]MDE1206027.1 hypothetical protein [Tenacibaculum larymnensis]
MNEEKNKASAVIAMVSASGASVGFSLAVAVGIPLTVPMAIGAGISCLAFSIIKVYRKN